MKAAIVQHGNTEVSQLVNATRLACAGLVPVIFIRRTTECMNLQAVERGTRLLLRKADAKC